MVNLKYFLLLILTLFTKSLDDDDLELVTGDIATIIVYFILSLVIVIISIIFINSKI
jgi:hypothetical protein